MVRKLPEVVSEHELSLAELPRDPHGMVRWHEVFGAERPLRIEVGVGNSSFLIEVSRGSPAFNYLGFEYSRKRVLKFLKKVHLAEVQNIRVLTLNAGSVLHSLFPPLSVEHFYINHPDPWPKRRHAKHRFVVASNVATMCTLLLRGGGISLRTDAPAYAVQMLEVLDAFDSLVNLAGKGRFALEPREPFETPYETKFRLQGLPIFYLEYSKR